MTARSTVDYSGLIVDQPNHFKVSGRLYHEPAVFDEEMDKIFHRGWVFVGHETEVVKAGDFVTRMIGLQPVIMSRDKDNQLHLLMNRCRHRSATVCQEEYGNATSFQCPYHGWTYASNGDLTRVPFKLGMAGYLDSFRQEEYGLARVPRVANHRGFIFASLSPTGVPFKEYLGRAAEYIDRYCDMAPDGEIFSTAGRHRMLVQSNWKLQVENLTDAYHVSFAHQSAIRRHDRDSSIVKVDDPRIYLRDIGGGHTVDDRFTGNRSLGEEATGRHTGGMGTLEPSVVAAVGERLGMEEAKHIAQGGPPHIMVFPNFMLLFNGYRMIQPVKPDLTYIYYYPTFLKGASEEVNLSRLRAQENAFGPAGFINPDDMDIFTRIQRGTDAQVDDWSVFDRSYDESMQPDEFGVPALTSQNLGETPQRAIWRHYKHVMTHS